MNKSFTFKIERVGGRECLTIRDERDKGIIIDDPEFALRLLRRPDGIKVQWSDDDRV